MSFLERVLAGARTERALTSTLAAPSAWLTDALTGGTTYSGKTVNVDSSLSLVPVLSAVTLLAGSVGSLPLVVYQRLERGRARAYTHRTWRMLHDQPSPELAADEMWEIVTGHLCLWGNAFIAKIHDPLDAVVELWPIRPSRVQVGRDDIGKFFAIDGAGRYNQRDILHIRGLGTDGLVGLSPIQQARQMLGGVMAQEEFSGSFWGNNAHPAGILKHPNRLSTEAAKRLKESWKAAHGGASKAGEMAVLEEGMDWQATGMPLEDAQFIETAQFNDLRVAQLFGVPPSSLGAKTGDSLTYATTEMQGIEFVRRSLRRWLVRIEKSLLRDHDLFTQGTRFFPEFLVEGLLRADSKSRAEFYSQALSPQTGWLDRNEVREMENLLPSTTKPAPADPPLLPEGDPADDPDDD